VLPDSLQLCNISYCAKWLYTFLPCNSPNQFFCCFRNGNESSAVRNNYITNFLVMIWNSNWYFESKAKMKTGNASSEKDMWLPAQEAEKVARLFTSSFPSFTKVMKRYTIYKRFQ